MVLLDEVLAELDYIRRQDLLERVLHCQQALLTTTDSAHFGEEFLAQACIWNIEAGRLKTS